MHSYIVNASLQIVPLTEATSAYQFIDEAIAIIQQSGIKYEVGAFATVVEGSYEDIFGLVHLINRCLQEKECKEWIVNLQVQLRSDRGITIEEKVQKFR